MQSITQLLSIIDDVTSISWEIKQIRIIVAKNVKLEETSLKIFSFPRDIRSTAFVTLMDCKLIQWRYEYE